LAEGLNLGGFSRQTGIPTAEADLERKLGRVFIQAFFGKKWIINCAS
jgi:hypothetical protein